MCLGIPMQIERSDGIVGLAQTAEGPVQIDLSLTGPVPPGSWVLTFLGAAREVIGADEAAKITDALNGLRRIMQGGDLGDSFRDLEATGPQLPPHLQAAQARGETEA